MEYNLVLDDNYRDDSGKLKLKDECSLSEIRERVNNQL
jgi:hypothetical protein